MGTVNIYIVEDETVVAMDIENVLERNGYAVSGIATTGERCLDEVGVQRPDLILMDIKLAGKIDGIETARIIRERHDIPIIFLTAHSDRGTLTRSRVSEPYGYIVKPINERELYTTIETSLYRYRIDKKLKESEKKYRVLFEQSRDPICLFTSEGEILDANQSMTELFSYNPDEILGLNIRDLFHDSGVWDEILDDIASNEIIRDYEALMVRSDGSSIECLVSTARHHGDISGGIGFQCIIRDITESKRNIRELIRSREEMRNLSSHLESLREIERTNIAREIHDVLGQSLTALKMDMSWLMKRIGKGESELLKKSSVMMDLVDSIIQTVRKISTELRPGIIDDLGLVAAIEWQAEEFQKRTGITCSVVSEFQDIIVDEKKSITYFRILQESLTNIIRHAHATEVAIELKIDNGTLSMEVRDNGRGIKEEEIHGSYSFGLIGIRERIYSCNGEVHISGTPGSGTSVRVVVPLDQENRE